MINNDWKNIHSKFTPQLQEQWEKNNFTYNQVQDWISIGLTPHDCPFAVYLRDVVSCEPEEALNFVANIEELRNQYQEYLQSQSEESEEAQLARATDLSKGVFNFNDNPLKGLTDEEAEQYLSTKRLNLKKYFVFNLGQEVKVNPKITISLGDEEEENQSELQSNNQKKLPGIPVWNVRKTQPLLTEHLTQLFNDGSEKSAIAFMGKNTKQGSENWTKDKLDQKIANGEEVYIVFDKSRIKANSSYVKDKVSLTDIYGITHYWNEIVPLAVEAKPQVQVFQSKKNVLKFLRDGDTNLFVKGLSEKERELLEQMGIDGSRYEAKELKRMLEYAGIAKQSKDKLPTGKGEIKKLIFFSPPHFQDKDCAVVVSQGKLIVPLPAPMLPLSPFPMPQIPVVLDKFDVLLLIYEAPWQKTGDLLYIVQVKPFSKLEDAENEADKLVERLGDENNPYPVCAVFEKVGDVFKAFSISAEIKGVAGIYSNVKKNPDGYFKFGDIAWRKIKSTNFFAPHHVAIYLGNGYVVHIYDESPDKKENQKLAKARIDTWEEFLKYNPKGGKIVRDHVFISYKQEELIKEHIVLALSSKEYGSGVYPRWALIGAGDYKKSNCQHFVNRCILGLNISNEGTIGKANEDEFLKNEILTTNQHFNSLSIRSNKELEQNQKQVDKLVAQIRHEPIWVWKKPVNLKPNPDCKLQ
jgi:hypothetical protein